MDTSTSSRKRLGRKAILFPLCLVLYEFSTYIANDMIQPGMLSVVEEFQVGCWQSCKNLMPATSGFQPQ